MCFDKQREIPVKMGQSKNGDLTNGRDTQKTSRFRRIFAQVCWSFWWESHYYLKGDNFIKIKPHKSGNSVLPGKCSMFDFWAA